MSCLGALEKAETILAIICLFINLLPCSVLFLSNKAVPILPLGIEKTLQYPPLAGLKTSEGAPSDLQFSLTLFLPSSPIRQVTPVWVLYYSANRQSPNSPFGVTARCKPAITTPESHFGDRTGSNVILFWTGTGILCWAWPLYAQIASVTRGSLTGY